MRLKGIDRETQMAQNTEQRAKAASLLWALRFRDLWLRFLDRVSGNFWSKTFGTKTIHL